MIYMFDDKILFFDFDGCIADSERCHLQASIEAVKELGITIDITPYFGIGLSDKKIYKQIEKDFNVVLPCDDIVALKAKKFEMLSSQIDIFPQMKDLIFDLPNTKFIITNSQTHFVENCLMRWKMEHCFNEIISLYYLFISKADMIIKLGYNPLDCVLFDDAILTVEEALDKNINGVLVKNGIWKILRKDSY